MMKIQANARSRWLPIALLLAVSCAGAASGAQELATGPDRPGWPKEFDARDSRIVVYEPQLETFRGNRMTARAAVSVTRPDASQPVFGAIWLDATLITDPERKIVTPLVVRITEARFPALGTAEAARLRQDIADEIPRWDLKYSVDDLLAELRLLEQQKAAADGLRTEVPRIHTRSAPAVLLAIQDEPAWRKTADPAFERLENCAAFVLREPVSGICYLSLPPFWWTSTDPLGPWKAADDVPAAVSALSRPQSPEADPAAETPRRPEVIPVTGAAELIWTDGAPQYAAITGTDLLYVRNTDSDVFLDTASGLTYALFSGRWYRTTASKDVWEFVDSERLPADFSRIPIDSEKRHVLASVAGTPQARDAVRNAEIPVTADVKPGPAPDLKVAYDGDPQFTDIPEAGVQYAVNTPYSVFCAERRYYWCEDGIWYDSDFPVGPWFVCVRVPRPIYLIPPSCPHYYVTYCHVFSVSPFSVTVGYYPGYCGSYVWHGGVVFGTGWHYRPWIGTHCYSRPVTWGLSVHYNPVRCGWSIRPNVAVSPIRNYRRESESRVPFQHAVAGGYWGGAGVQPYRRGPDTKSPSPAPPQNLYERQPDRRLPPPVRPADRTPFPPVRRDPGPAEPNRRPEREPERPPVPPRDHREIPRTPPPAEREIPRTPPPDREVPKPPPPREPREIPRTPPPPPPRRESPPPPDRNVPRRVPPPEYREAPRTPPPPPPPPPRRETPPPPQHREEPQHRQEQKSPPQQSERRR